jgi:hypothetical protein
VHVLTDVLAWAGVLTVAGLVFWLLYLVVMWVFDLLVATVRALRGWVARHRARQ